MKKYIFQVETFGSESCHIFLEKKNLAKIMKKTNKLWWARFQNERKTFLQLKDIQIGSMYIKLQGIYLLENY